MTFFLIILMSYLDRIRGTSFRIFPGDIRLLMGWCLAAILGYSFSPITIGIVVLFALGESMGWGTPLGASLEGKPMDQTRLEWWQRGVLKTNKWLALTVRGVMWGLPVAILGIFDPTLYFLPLITGVAMTLSVWVISLTSKDWAHQEILRGLLIGVMAAIVANVS